MSKLRTKNSWVWLCNSFPARANTFVLLHLYTEWALSIWCTALPTLSLTPLWRLTWRASSLSTVWWMPKAGWSPEPPQRWKWNVAPSSIGSTNGQTATYWSLGWRVRKTSRQGHSQKSKMNKRQFKQQNDPCYLLISGVGPKITKVRIVTKLKGFVYHYIFRLSYGNTH